VLKRALLSVNVGDDVFVCRVFDWFLRGLALDMLHRIGFLEFFYVISLCEMTSKKNCGVQVVFSCKNWFWLDCVTRLKWCIVLLCG
jgi:hypothetical protein